MRLGLMHIVACLAAAALPAIWQPWAPQQPSAPFPGWPAQFEGLTLRPEALAEREGLYLEDFPGRIAKFTDGRRQIIFRWVTQPTRKLHLSTDCFRGTGYHITPEPAVSRPDERGQTVHWSRFTAMRGGERLLVSERIFDEAGRSWPEISAWYWAALTHKTAGPWWAVTIVEPEQR